MSARGRLLGALAGAAALVGVGALLATTQTAAPRPATAGTHLGSATRSQAPSVRAETKTTAPQTPCARATAGWTTQRLLAQLLMLNGHFTDPSTLAAPAAAGVGAFEMAFAPGVQPRTKPATRTRVRNADASIVADATRAKQVAPILSNDEEGGVVTRLAGVLGRLPSPRAMASAWTTARVAQVMAARGREMKALGIDMDTAPLYTTASVHNTVGEESTRSFSTSPAVASAYANAFARGLASAGVLAVAKEFPGEGRANEDTDWAVATDPPLATLRAHTLLSFDKAGAGEVRVVMVGHPVVPGLTQGLPASLSPATYTLLRRTSGFAGLIITDTLGVKAISIPGYRVPAAVVKAVEAGADMPMLQAPTWRSALGALEHAVSTGSLPLGVVHTRVAHVLESKGVCKGAIPPASS